MDFLIFMIRQPYEQGTSLGQTGSKAGTITHDEKHVLGARISLERGCRAAPFTITCGIYGWMLHTRYFACEQEAETQYQAMKQALAALLDEADKAAVTDGGHQVPMNGAGKFVGRFP